MSSSRQTVAIVADDPRPSEPRPSEPYEAESRAAEPIAEPVPLHGVPDFPDTYDPAELARRRDGWTVERQHIFLSNLAATGCVSIAALHANMTPRSAYRLRNHPKGQRFARAWEAALLTASNRLMAVAFDRALVGTRRNVWVAGKMMCEHEAPSDRLLMFLLKHLSPQFFAPDPDPAARRTAIDAAQAAYPAALAGLINVDVEGALIDPSRDFNPQQLPDEPA